MLHWQLMIWNWIACIYLLHGIPRSQSKICGFESNTSVLWSMQVVKLSLKAPLWGLLCLPWNELAYIHIVSACGVIALTWNTPHWALFVPILFMGTKNAFVFSLLPQLVIVAPMMPSRLMIPHLLPVLWRLLKWFLLSIILSLATVYNWDIAGHTAV